MTKLNNLLERVEVLEKELFAEIYQRHEDLKYTIEARTVEFSEDVRRHHAKLAATLSEYVYDSGILKILTIPIIWSVLVPAFLLDALVSMYQAICFPVYGIPCVKRNEYVVIDRHTLQYLNGLEKLNCMYCGYFNGLVGYIREVAARTEQYWCPVRHARPAKAVHSRYRKFFEYGDADGYREGLAKVREDFKDLK
ncbi:MAG: hypothetical protein JEY79_03270 [Pseudodesulfovibrio sp.]|jgi:hypothetical protein|nr:hypothetical protein [Pseudodesulfovibrio sp.]